jgi:hypothetical protein
MTANTRAWLARQILKLLAPAAVALGCTAESAAAVAAFAAAAIGYGVEVFLSHRSRMTPPWLRR